ncbi:hypothetical protein WJX72_003249 [[Myrmecia] bisecta]|uniref:carotenoid 9,10-dioxygenase n=1 Tax=[Myrmecia] bisecta TaxID=41462 RepID=A0AAW1PFZ2_9CHLO
MTQSGQPVGKQRFCEPSKSQYEEKEYWITEDRIDGEIPKELRGTLLRNGPGLLEVGGHKLPQPFDGDGLVCSFAFNQSKCYFQSRFVRTEAFVKEQEAHRMLYRGAFTVGGIGGGWFNPFDFSLASALLPCAR